MIKFNYDEFIQLSVDEILIKINGLSHLILLKNDKLITYEIIDTKEQLIRFLNDMITDESNKTKEIQSKGVGVLEPFNRYAMVNYEIKNSLEIEILINNCINLIFLKPVFLNQFSPLEYSVKIKKILTYVNFRNCVFKDFVSLGGKEENNQSILVYQCEVYKNFVINGNVDFIDIKSSNFHKDMSPSIFVREGNSLQINRSKVNISIQNSEFDKIEFFDLEIQKAHFSNVVVNKKFIISNCSLLKKSFLTFNSFILTNFGMCTFKEIKGKISLQNSVFQNMTFDFDSLKNTQYKCIEKIAGGTIDYENINDTLKSLFSIAKSNHDSRFSLELEFLIKKYKLKAYFKKFNQDSKYWKFVPWLLKKIYEISIAHFCKWKNILITAIGTNFLFAFIYFLNFDKLKGVTDNDVWEKVITSLYFSFITFTTVGYGDISFNLEYTYLKLLSGLEGFIGVILMTFLTVTIVRRYSK